MLAAMATPWDRAAAGYLEEWVPRFVPYHLDLVRVLALNPGGRVLVTSCGPGAEVLAVARAVGDEGHVVATDSSEEMVRLCQDQARAGAFENIETVQADASDTRGRKWDAILCAFGLWQISDRESLVSAWASALAPRGKVGILTWGPPAGEGPFEILASCLHELEPGYEVPNPHLHAEREPMARLFDQGGLVMVRHTIIRHTLAWKSAAGTSTSACATIASGRIPRQPARTPRHISTDRPIWNTSAATRSSAKMPAVCGLRLARIMWMRISESGGRLLR